VSLFHFSSPFIIVSFHSIVARILYIMFHPVFVSLCFSIIYIVFHSIPSSSFGALHYHDNASCYDLYLNASSEYSSFNNIPLSFFLTSQRTRMSHTCSSFISLLILLSGDIQSNPGPVSHVSSLNMCTLYIRAFTYTLHYTAIAGFAYTYNIDVFALTETWIAPYTISAQLFDAIPCGFTFINTPRPVPDSYNKIYIYIYIL